MASKSWHPSHGIRVTPLESRHSSNIIILAFETYPSHIVGRRLSEFHEEAIALGQPGRAETRAVTRHSCVCARVSV